MNPVPAHFRLLRMQTTARRLFSLGQASWRETLVLMFVAWLVPFVVHLVPWDGARPLGAHLLPAFWTAFVAVYLYGFRVGLLIALVVPVANLLATGLPVPARAALLSLELVLFVGFAAWLLHRWPALRFAAVLAWPAAMAVTVLVRWLWSEPSRPVLDSVAANMAGGLAGLSVLAALNLALVQLLPKDRAWDAD